MDNLERAREVAANFTDSDIQDVQVISDGFLHQTFLVVTGDGKFVMQRAHDVIKPEVQEDIKAVTGRLQDEGVETFEVIETRDGGLFVQEGPDWFRAMTYLDGETTKLTVSGAESAAAKVAEFHEAVAGMDYEFKFAIPHFHDTRYVLDKLKRRYSEYVDESSELAMKIKHAIAGLVSAVIDAGEEMVELFEGRELPKRLIHGDLKFTNILFERGTDEAKAVIDLDTMMMSTIAVELGDAARSWCNKAAEDDAENSEFDLEIFEAMIKGYFEKGRKFLTREERGSIVDGVLLITIELAMRFLEDAMEGEYFGWDNERFEARWEHNLERVKAQFKLFNDLKAKKEEAEEIVRRYS